MNSTLLLFEDRVSEIEFYYSIMLEIENGSRDIRTIDNHKFQRMLKSNFLLMLYNLVEACIVSGMLEIYEHLKDNDYQYSDLIEEIRIIWSNYQIGKTYTNQGGRTAYEKRVQDIIKQVITHQPILLNREAIGIRGNFDAKAIKELCDKHRIRYTVPDDSGYLRLVKDKRNHLAHGDESFGDCARDMTLTDLRQIKDAVVKFIEAILRGMKEYYDNKLYLASVYNI